MICLASAIASFAVYHASGVEVTSWIYFIPFSSKLGNLTKLPCTKSLCTYCCYHVILLTHDLWTHIFLDVAENFGNSVFYPNIKLNHFLLHILLHNFIF